MAKIVMYTTKTCPYCLRAKRLLEQCGIKPHELEEIRLDNDPVERQNMMAKTGRRSVPQIYIGENYVGGYDELALLEKQGKLMPMLSE